MSMGSGEVFAADVSINNSTEYGGITQGIDDISDGDTLILADGNYKGSLNSNITIDKNVTIKGSSKSNTVIYADSNIAFIVEEGNTLTLINLTIVTNYLYSGTDATIYGGIVHRTNGTISGQGDIFFEDCNFVNNMNNVLGTVNALPIYSSTKTTFTATFTDLSGNNINNGDAVFYIDDVYSGRVQIINGIATYSVNLPNGAYNIHAIYVLGSYDKIGQNQLSFIVDAPPSIVLFGAPIPDTNTSRYMYVCDLTGDDSRDGRTLANAKKSISNAFSSANPGDIIIIQPGTYSGNLNVGFTLANKNMTIWGNDTDGDIIILTTNSFITLSAGSAPTNKRSLSLYNLKIIGGDGNKITINNNNILYVDSVVFANYTGSGRAIFIANAATYVDIIVNNTLFTNFTGTTGEGKAIGTTATTTAGNNGFVQIYNTNFTNIIYTGTAQAACAINYYATNSSYLYINNSNFENCWGSSFGGVIRCFNGAPVTLNFTNFTNSGATSQHGGIFCLSGTGSSLTVDNSRFTNIRSNTNEGGVTYTHNGPTTFLNTIFENCSASTNGGVIRNGGNGSITITNCTFKDCSAGTNGSVIHTNGSANITISNSSFMNNYVNGTATSAGGAIYAGNGIINITNTNFTNNYARGPGGAILAGGATMNLINVNFVNNSAGTFGGAISAGSGTIRINISNFDNNSAGSYGGALGVAGGTVNLTNANFNDNRAVTYGGAIGSSGTGTVNVLYSNFTGNRVNGTTGFGGAIGASGGTINFDYSNFRNNSATFYGGALGVSGNSTVNVLNSNLTGNFVNGGTTSYGGAVGIAGGKFYGFMSNFDYNNATGYGGAIGAVASLNISFCNFTYNTAGTNGGAIGSNSPNGTDNYVFSNNFMWNSAGSLGNAIYANQSLTLNYNRLVSNFNAIDPTNPYNTVWTNATPAIGRNINVDYNWWGNNEQYAFGVQPNNYVVVNMDINNVGLWNSSANYMYTIKTNNSDPNFNVSRLPTFYGEMYILQPSSYTVIFNAHTEGYKVVPFNPLAYQLGYAKVDNWRIPEDDNTFFNVSTKSDPTVDVGKSEGKFRDIITLNATFKDDRNFGIAGLNVSFYVGGVYVGSNFTDENGFVSLEYYVHSAGNFSYYVDYTHIGTINPLYLNYNPITTETSWLYFDKLNTTIVNVTNATGRSGLPIGLGATIVDEKDIVIITFCSHTPMV